MLNQSPGDVCTGWWALVLIPYPILPLSQISHTVSVDIKHHEKRKKALFFQICDLCQCLMPDTVITVFCAALCLQVITVI